jgi:hypothetical protein
MLVLSHEVIELLEAMLTVPVPEAYLRFLSQQMPNELRTRCYEGLTRRIADHELYDDPEQILAANEMVREEPLWGEGDEEEAPWRPTRLVIGMDMSGDVVFVDAAAVERGVFRYVVSSGRVIPVRPDLPSYAASLVSNDPTLPRS